MRKKFNAKNILRSVILNLDQYTAGRSVEEITAKYNLDPNKILKLGSNENVLGPSQKAIKAAYRALQKVNIYPEMTADTLCKKIKKLHKLKNVEVVAGNGMDHIFEMLARLFLNNSDETIISVPTFSCYELITLWAGAKPRLVPLLKDTYQLNVKKILSLVNKKTKIIFICSPNNPTGNLMKEKDIKTILATNKIVFLDEAYIEFTNKSHVKWIEKYPNLIIGRTFSKIYGLAGLRIGYAFLHKYFYKYYINAITPFVVSRVGQAAGISALDDKSFVAKSKHLANSGKDFYHKEFNKAGVIYYPSGANFIAIKTKKEARVVSEALLKAGIITRECSTFGKGGERILRITIGTKEQNKIVINALKELKRKKYI